MRYQVKLNKIDQVYAIWCPALPGCWTVGNTEQEALEKIKYVIQDYLQKIDDNIKNSEFYYIDV
ncbi:MAG: type II toxin-antitoxin system HicB family antitoxin [Sphaerospermopsis sp. SIO1G2]|nr:type II toxin-antitoxin system HicB family antitoxin [Sphaerospermopsis sp. SIO1G1]NET70400.1 type II toxin-antitoxin system HicB family antitoxin [Sphaerospermopsis sp. SIO1G2]